MALQFDGNGEVTFTEFTAAGSFTVAGIHTVGSTATEIWLGYSAASTSFVGYVNAIGGLRARVDGVDLDSGVSVSVGDTVVWSLSRSGTTATFTVNGVDTTAAASGTFRCDRLGSFNGGASKYTGLASRHITMTGGGGFTRAYSTETSTGTTLKDTSLGFDGTLSGFTTGGFVAGATAFDFTGANGDPLPAGLTAQNGSFQIQSNTLTGSGADPLGAKWLCTAPSIADCTVECIVNNNSNTGGASGVIARYSDNNNAIMLVLGGAGGGDVQLFRLQAGSFTELAAYSMPSYSSSANYVLRLECNGSSLTGYLNGDPVVSATESFNSTETLVGVRLGRVDHRVDDLSFTEEASGDSISIDDSPRNNYVYQRASDGDADISFDITYSGTPTALQYRLLDATDDTTEIVGWTTFDASPSGGASTLSITVSGTTTPIHAQVRFSNDTGVTDLQVNDWYVGDKILIFGQSLAEDLNTDGVVTAQDGYFVYNGTTSAAPTTGVGAEAIADVIIGSDGCAVEITNTAVGGTALAAESLEANYWNDATGPLWTDTVTRVNNMTNGDNNIAFAWWHQGTRDSLTGVTESEYSSALTTFFARVRSTFTDKDGSTLPIIMATLGRDTRGTATNTSHQGIRDAQIAYIDGSANTYGVAAYTSATTDGVHATEAAYIILGQNIALQYAGIKGDISSAGLFVQNVYEGDSATEIDLVYNQSLLLSDTTYSTEGVRVEDDGVATTVSSFARKNTNTATITLSAAPSGALTVWLGYGAGTGTTQLTYPRSEAKALPSTGGSFSSLSEAISEEAVEEAPAAGIPLESRVTATEVAAYLRTQGFSGSTNDVIYNWLGSLGYEGSLNDRWMDYWDSFGYTGSFTDKRYTWLKT